MPYYPEKKPEPSGEKQRQPETAERRTKLLRRFAAAVSCLLIPYGSLRLILYQAELNASRNTSRELRQAAEEVTKETEEAESPSPPPEETAAPALPAAAPEESPAPDSGTEEVLLQPVPYPDNPDLQISERFRKLRKKGRYIVGWLSFDQTDEAVAQKDNAFFLNHDARGNRNSNGAVFLDQDVSLRTRPYTVILYGHNMKSGNMFGRLKKYRENAYFYSHRIVTFDSLYENGQYAVFAVMEMSTTPGPARWYSLKSLDTDSRADREEALRTLESRSLVKSALDVRAEDQLLLLVTCLDGETERLVVAARRLRDGETPDGLQLRTGP